MMKYIICSETCTIQAVEKWRNVRTKSPRLFSAAHQDAMEKKWKWDTSFAQTLIICMINERCQDQNPNGRRTQLEVSTTEMKRSINPSPACLIRACSDPFPEQSNVLFASPAPPILFLLPFYFFFLKLWNSLYIWIKTSISNHRSAIEGKTTEMSMKEAMKKHNTIKSFFTA